MFVNSGGGSGDGDDGDGDDGGGGGGMRGGWSIKCSRRTGNFGKTLHNS